MAAPASSSSHKASRIEFQVPEGWVLVSKPNKKGELVKYYTNILGQRFYSESDLMRNIRDAKGRGLAIYAPDFVPPTTGSFAMPSKLKAQTVSASDAEQVSPQTTGAFATPNKLKVETDSTSDAKHISKNNGRHEASTSRNIRRIKPENQSEAKSHQNAECTSAPVDEVHNEDEVQCARALLEISCQRTVERRASRRLAGLQPELRIDFDFNRAFEYIIKDKPL